MPVAAIASLMGAETVLALTPIVIKRTPLDPVSVIWSRLLSSATLGFLLSSDRTLPSAAAFTALGGANLLHVASSFEAFRNLPVGQAMALLYTYPVWNILLGAAFEGEALEAHEIGLVVLAAVGAVLLQLAPGSTTAAVSAAPGQKPNSSWGVFNGLVMALTESGIHTLLHAHRWLDPAKSIWILNASAALWFLGARTLGGGKRGGGEEGDDEEGEGSLWDTVGLTGFNVLSSFGGYWLRFYAVPRLRPVLFSILSYTGLLAAYMFGLLFMRERPSWLSVMGALLILVSGVALMAVPSPRTE